MGEITFDTIFSIYEKGIEIKDRFHLLNLIYQTLYRMEKGKGVVVPEKGVVEMDIAGLKHRPILLYSRIKDDSVEDIGLLSYLFYRVKPCKNSFRFLFLYGEMDKEEYGRGFVKILEVKYGNFFRKSNEFIIFSPVYTDEVAQWICQL